MTMYAMSAITPTTPITIQTSFGIMAIRTKAPKTSHKPPPDDPFAT